MCGSLYRTCCLSLSPFLSTPKKLLLQKDLCLPLGERRARRTRRTTASTVTAEAATGGGLQLARLPGALNQARQTRRSTRLSTTVRNFKLMEAALPWISESEAAKSTAPHYAPVPSRAPRQCHAVCHAASTAAAASAEFNARYGRASP